MEAGSKKVEAPDVEGTRAEVRRVMEAEGLSQTAVAKASGVPLGTLSSWLAGTYQGRNERVAADVVVWLRARDEQRRAASTVPQVPAYVETATAGAVIEALRYAQLMADVAVIAGGAGIGKTTACEHYAGPAPMSGWRRWTP